MQPPQVLGMDERLSNVRPPVPWLIEQHGGRWGRYGWYLAAGDAGELRIGLPGSTSGLVKIRLWAHSPGRLGVTIVDRDGSRRIANTDGRILTVPVSGEAVLWIEAANRANGDRLVLDRVAATRVAAADAESIARPLWVALAFVIAGWGLIARSGRSGPAVNRWAGWSLILLAAASGWGHRWELFEVARGLPLDPDAVAYLNYARSLAWFTPEHGFFSGSFAEREPLHVAALNLWFGLLGETAPAARMMTLALSVLLIVVTGTFVWSVSDRWYLGAAAAWVMALSPAWIAESVRGLRLEAMTLLTLGLLWTWLRGRGWTGALILGAATDVAALLFSPALSVFLPMFWGAWLWNQWLKWTRRPPAAPCQWRWLRLLVASALAVSLYVPHLYGLYRVHGDPSWPSHGYARWNANVEFPGRLGSPGFPSREEFEHNPYAGPRLSYREYLFDLHSPQQLLWGQFKGWSEALTYMSVSITPGLTGLISLLQASGARAAARQVDVPTILFVSTSLGLTALGWLRLWFSRQLWWAPFLTLWGTWYVAYLYSVRLVEPFRHTGHVYPLLLLCMVWGAHEVVSFVRGRITGRSTTLGV